MWDYRCFMIGLIYVFVFGLFFLEQKHVYFYLFIIWEHQVLKHPTHVQDRGFAHDRNELMLSVIPKQLACVLYVFSNVMQALLKNSFGISEGNATAFSILRYQRLRGKCCSIQGTLYMRKHLRWDTALCQCCRFSVRCCFSHCALPPTEHTHKNIGWRHGKVLGLILLWLVLFYTLSCFLIAAWDC